MSGFSAEWLALREGADHAARNGDVARAAAALLAGKKPARIIDLGAGAGSNFRGFSPLIDAPQVWTLVDHEARLLAAAREKITPLLAGQTRIAVDYAQVDLMRDVELLLARGCDLVTAAAFFDLASEAWIARFCAALAERRLPLYAILSYDGVEHWRPPHALDARILAAFAKHQATDKGFGPAAGPRAHGVLRDALARHGYSVMEGASPWRLSGDQRALMRQLAQGIAAAAQESGEISAAEASAWRAAREAATGCDIGHLDLLAAPGVAGT